MSRELLVQCPDGQMKNVPLTAGRLAIGRSSAVELSFPEDAGLSRQHFAFEVIQFPFDGFSVQAGFQHLRRLRAMNGSTFLDRAELQSVRRLFLAGHSGGGVPLAPAAASTLALSVPTDLWLYDCTYGPQRNPSYVHFCRHWRARGLLGNHAQASRMAIFVTPDPRTTSVAADIIQTLRRPFVVDGKRFPGLTYARLTRTGLIPSSAAADIVEAMPTATVQQIERALRTSPVVFVHTQVAHDHIPFVWTPRLLGTAAVPQ